MRRKIFSFFKFFFLTVFVASSTVACNTTLSKEKIHELLSLDMPSEPADLSVEQLVKIMDNTIDPKQQFKKANSYILRQKIVDMKAYTEMANIMSTKENKKYTYEEYETELKFKSPNMIRQTSIRNGTPFSILLLKDGRAWDINPRTNKATEIMGHRLDLTRAFTMMSNPANSILDAFPDVRVDCVYIGKMRHYRLICRAANPDIAPYIIYVNAETYLQTKAETILYTDDGNMFLYTALPSNFQRRDGILLPTRTTIEVGENKDISTLLEFDVDVNFKEADFDLPSQLELN